MATTMTPTDLSAIAQDLSTDIDGAFAAYVRATADGIFTGALRMLGDRSDAEDVMQETYARAYNALAGYPPKRIEQLKVSGWTWTIAANLCRNRLRSRARKPTSPLGDADVAETGAGPDEEALSHMSAVLQAALLTLPFPQRAAVVLRHVLDMTYDEVAWALGRPVGTIKADVHRGLARLREIYPEEDAK
ncbi:MAG: sigma-70 family RNA polymerase sigma factor [Acidimicrobiia bacterium]